MKFRALNRDLDKPEPTASTPPPANSQPLRSPARVGKKGVSGHFSPELSRTLNVLAIEEGTTVQALMGEAFDLLLRKRGKHPFGER